MIDQYEIAERVVAAGYGSGPIGIYKAEVAKIIQERVGGLCSDHKSFLYIRLHDMHKRHGLGGGNITSALAAFSALSLLIKVCYFIDKPEKFEPDSTYYFKTNEENAFCHFIKMLAGNNIHLGINKDDHIGQKLVWGGFRNYLAHLGTPEEGKGVVAFELRISVADGETVDIDQKADEMVALNVFSHDGTGRNWQVNIDVLFAKIDKIIVPFLVDKIIQYKVDDEQSARNLYKLVSGMRYLP